MHNPMNESHRTTHVPLLTDQRKHRRPVIWCAALTMSLLTCVAGCEADVGTRFAADSTNSPTAAPDECLQYIACLEHFAPSRVSLVESTRRAYGTGGDCWDDAETAEACSVACTDANESLKDEVVRTGQPTGPCE